MDPLKQIHHLVRDFRITVFAFLIDGRGEPGKPGIELLRILHLGHDQDDALRVQGDRLYHEWDIFRFKAEFTGRLLHHIAKQVLCLVGAVGKFTYFKFPAEQIFSGQRTTYLVVIYFFYFHNNHIL